jgi:hypothetical protein
MADAFDSQPDPPTNLPTALAVRVAAEEAAEATAPDRTLSEFGQALEALRAAVVLQRPRE